MEEVSRDESETQPRKARPHDGPRPTEEAENDVKIDMGPGRFGGTGAGGKESGPQGAHRGFTRPHEQKRGEPGPKTPVSEVEKESRKWYDRVVLWRSCLCIIAYLCVGVGVYGYRLEKWGALKAIYFCVVTFTSVGYGDLSPTNPHSRLFTIFFAVVGISVIALAVSEISTHLEKKRNESIEEVNKAVIARVKGEDDEENVPGWGGRSYEVFNLCVKALLPVVVINAVGVSLIAFVEGWNALQAAYYAVTTFTTIGYGDAHVEKRAAIWVAVFYIPFSVLAVGNAISLFVEYASRDMERKRRENLLSHAFDWDGLFEMDRNGDHRITQYEFTVYMLKLWKMVDEGVLEALHGRFKELDSTGNGVLTEEDFTKDAQRRREKRDRRVDDEKQQQLDGRRRERRRQRDSRSSRGGSRGGSGGAESRPPVTQ